MFTVRYELGLSIKQSALRHSRVNFHASMAASRQNTACELQTFTGVILQLSSEDGILVYP